MNIKEFFKLKIVLFAITAMIVTGFFARASAVSNPVFWFTLIPSPPSGPGENCMDAIFDIPLFGWPLQFLKYYGADSCKVDLLLNPISLIFNIGIFLIIGRVIFRKKCLN